MRTQENGKAENLIHFTFSTGGPLTAFVLLRILLRFLLLLSGNEDISVQFSRYIPVVISEKVCDRHMRNCLKSSIRP